MRITLRIILSTFGVISVLVVLFTFLQVRQEKERMTIDLESRAAVLGETLKEAIDPLVERGRLDRIQKILERFGTRERLAGVGVYDAQDRLIAGTSQLAGYLKSPPALITTVMNGDQEQGAFVSLEGNQMYLYALPLYRDQRVAGALLILYSTTHFQERTALIWQHNFVRWLLSALAISLITIVVARRSMAKPIARMAEWMRTLRKENGGAALSPPPTIFEPLTREVIHMARAIAEARLAAEQEARLRRNAESLWTPSRLKEQIRALLRGRPFFVISNREPYVHERRGKNIEVRVPPSGLVTALEPVLHACGGTWIAHGNGDADREVVDAGDKIQVPPEEPQYTLKRVWLTREEEEGYYYGFSNEGLWPLCHIAHTRPSFRVEDWNFYVKVNEKFTSALIEEMKDAVEPWVLVQDYHFALLPRMIKEKRPDARVALFWHIPWPNPESFGICPWRKEILHGMLGSDLIGFHVQFHCNNFLDTVDRALESTIDWEHFTVRREGQLTRVKPFPISIGSSNSGFRSVEPGGFPGKEELLRGLGVQAKYLGVGVDRIDYTKGIQERFLSIERFLERNPEYRDEFTFVELAAPSRTQIKEYRDLVSLVEGEAERINGKFQNRRWKPIVLLVKQHSHDDILPFYKSADLCMVTSLHDGMNLVAKEFIGAQEEESGVLILSEFTGAARELRDALIVNPYDIEQMADAIRAGLAMDAAEKRSRMQRMRETVKEKNIYRWAGDLVGSLAEIRISGAPLDAGVHSLKNGGDGAESSARAVL
ncbi:MAG TPA: trehalose-6-phosphate synthase [Thermodesulfobacteriota bacterium]|nr:trehalose-6-phosphate synthase [Thermodesulfobacteriota bacterium]